MNVRNDRRQRRGGPRGKSNGNERGSAAQRRARKKWLIATFPALERYTFMERVITMTIFTDKSIVELRAMAQRQ